MDNINHKYVFIGAVVVALAVAVWYQMMPSPYPGPMMGLGNKTTGIMPSRGGGYPAMMEEGRSSADSYAPADANSKNSQVLTGALTERKVVKSGTLSVLVDKVDDAAAGIQQIAKRFDGFINDSRVWESGSGMKSGSVTIRVPAARFDEAMAEIKKLAVKVESENTTADDVTESYIDLEARLKNAKAQEEEYLKILKQATSVQDILNVTQYLTSTRQQIEQLQGQLQFLSRQVDMSTISVSIRAEADVEVFGLRWRPLVVAKQALRDMVSSLTGYIDTMIRFVIYLPVLALWIATLGVVIYIIRWFVRRFTAKKPTL